VRRHPEDLAVTPHAAAAIALACIEAALLMLAILLWRFR
jgi:hypothetical protein